MAVRAEQRLRLLAILVLASALSSAPALAGEPPCRAENHSIDLAGDLGSLRQRLREGGDITIVAIGSSSTSGAGASAPDRAYPAQLERHLAQLWPQRRVKVINRGINGEEAADMIRRFGEQVLQARPDLVIWQVGTNYLMRNEGVGGYGKTLNDGLDRLRHGGVSVILMDPQYAPRVLADPDHDAIVALIGDTARQRQVPLFSRFQLMKGWVKAGVLWSQMLTADMLHLNDWSYDCIAQSLAIQIHKNTKD
jgi:acyl-CoA thioesterase-1